MSLPNLFRLDGRTALITGCRRILSDQILTSIEENLH